MIQVKSYRYMLTGIFWVAKVNIGHLLSFWKSNTHEFQLFSVSDTDDGFRLHRIHINDAVGLQWCSLEREWSILKKKRHVKPFFLQKNNQFFDLHNNLVHPIFNFFNLFSQSWGIKIRDPPRIIKGNSEKIPMLKTFWLNQYFCWNCQKTDLHNNLVRTVNNE